MVEWLMTVALKGMWKDTVVVQLLFRLLPAGTEYNREKPTDNRRPSAEIWTQDRPSPPWAGNTALSPVPIKQEGVEARLLGRQSVAH